MSEHLNSVVREYLAYRQLRANLKKKHRLELNNRSKPALEALGQVIQEARKAGFRVGDIMQVMGMKNRNFMYEAIGAYTDANDVEVPEVPEVQPEATPDYEEPIVMRASDTQVSIIFDRLAYTLAVTPEGVIQSLPEAFLRDLNEKKKKQVQGIIASTRELWAD